MSEVKRSIWFAMDLDGYIGAYAVEPVWNDQYREYEGDFLDDARRNLAYHLYMEPGDCVEYVRKDQCSCRKEDACEVK